jgi:transposase-like protein
VQELSVAEERYQAVLAVLSDGAAVAEAAARFGVARKTVPGWPVKYGAGGLEYMSDRSDRHRSCPHQMAAALEEARRAHPVAGPRRIRFDLARHGAKPPSESGSSRRAAVGLVEPDSRTRRGREWKRSNSSLRASAHLR